MKRSCNIERYHIRVCLVRSVCVFACGIAGNKPYVSPNADQAKLLHFNGRYALDLSLQFMQYCFVLSNNKQHLLCAMGRMLFV